MDNGVKYLVNADDFVATRIALMNAKLNIGELIAVYQITNSADVTSLVQQQNELQALINRLDYHNLNLSR
jgi:hypothetical protein